MSPRKNILIVGGGVAGLDLAGQLAGAPAKRLGLDIRLIDREPAHVWKPMLHTIAAGTADTGANQTAYLVQAQQRGFRFEMGEVMAVDRAAKQVLLAPLVVDGAEILPARSLPYDKLVLAAGSRANDFGTPGVVEHCMTIDCRREAIAFSERLRVAMLQAIASNDHLSIAIVGAGATGVELASELVRLADVLEQHGASGARSGLKIYLIESQPRILGPFPERVAHAAHTVLESLGIEVLTQARVLAGDADGFQLADGRRIEASIKLWAAGVRAPEFVAAIDGLDHSRLGQVIVNPNLATPNDPDIFALGDCASVMLPGVTTRK